jgi:tripartite-type tricarboxylate transporter receptor subunit TctC
VRTGLGARTLADLIALAKQKPGELSFGSGGPGSSAHLGMELLLEAAGIRGQHIPFRGVAAAITEVMAGRVDMVIASA